MNRETIAKAIEAEAVKADDLAKRMRAQGDRLSYAREAGRAERLRQAALAVRESACEDCDGTGTITDPAPDAPGARPPEVRECGQAHVEAPPPRTLPVTPAERFLAAVLRAHRAWNVAGEPPSALDGAVVEIAQVLSKYCLLVSAGIVTAAGRDLLARVEAEERTPEVVLRAMLRAYEASELEAMIAIRKAKHPHDVFLRFVNSDVAAAVKKTNARSAARTELICEAACLLADPAHNIRLSQPGLLADYQARLAGTRPLDAPPMETP